MLMNIVSFSRWMSQSICRSCVIRGRTWYKHCLSTPSSTRSSWSISTIPGWSEHRLLLGHSSQMMEGGLYAALMQLLNSVKILEAKVWTPLVLSIKFMLKASILWMCKAITPYEEAYRLWPEQYYLFFVFYKQNCLIKPSTFIVPCCT